MGQPMMLMMILCILGTYAEPDYEVQVIESNPGLYFEKIETIRFKRAEWNAVMHLDIKRMLKQSPEGLAEYAKIHADCIKMDVYCGLLQMGVLDKKIVEAEKSRKELEEYANELVSIRPETLPHSIVRRDAPFSFIGSASRSLFGTLNYKDLDNINSELGKLYTGQSKLVKLMKTQTHLVASELHKLHDTGDRLQSEIEKHRTTIHGIIETTNKLMNDTQQLAYKISLHEYSTALEKGLNYYIEAIDQFMTTIQTARDGKIDANLLTADQLKEMIQEIHETAGNYEIPLPRFQHRSEEIAKIASTDVVYHGGKILVNVKLPLAERADHYLYRMHTWPTPQMSNNRTISAQIIPQSRYLGISENHQTYFLPDEKYVQGCVKTRYCHLCPSQTPLYDVGTSKGCEISLLLNPDVHMLRQCDIRIKDNYEPFWTRLNSIGGWLYSLDKPEVIQIICKNLRDQLVVLNGTGILYSKGKCMGKTSYITLPGVEVFVQKDQYLYQPNLALNINSISPILINYNLLKPIEDSTTITKTNFETGKSLYEVEEQLEELGERQKELGEQRSTKKRHSYLIYGGYLMQAGIAIGTTIFCFRIRLISKFIKNRRGILKVTQDTHRDRQDDIELAEVVSEMIVPAKRTTTNDRPLPKLPKQQSQVD